MKLALLTALALNAAVSSADDDAAGIRGAIRSIPKLFGAEQLIDVGKHNDVQPDYCYERPDYYCYKKGHPKCCTKDKGNCPNGNQPGCECGGQNCNPDMDNDDNRSPTTCEEDNDCERNEYCRFQAGKCGRGAGICEQIPSQAGCPMNYDPVCGCNGRQYSNECDAGTAGVSINYYGECENDNPPSPTTCMEDNDCDSDEFCKTQTGTCGAREGICKQMPGPSACTFEYDPVCGCNGREYSNDCDAEAAGVSIKYYGQCEDSGPTVCVKDNDCDGDEYCFFKLATCGARDGICKQVPDAGACPMDYDPVCGCNGREYSNDCIASNAGVSIKYYGQC